MFASSALSARTLQRPAFTAAPIARRPFVIENAQKKGQGSTKNGRDSNAQRRGCKVYGGQPVKAGGIIFRQVGSTWYPGENVGVGSDFTIFSKVEGIVVYDKKKYKPKISVLPLESEEAKKVIEASHTTKPAEGTVSRKERAREYFRAKRAAKREAAGIANVPQ